MSGLISVHKILELAPFRTLTVETAVEILTAGEERHFETGSHVYRQGEPGDTFSIILEGAVSVWLNDAGVGREVARLGPGECIGEMAMLSGAPRSASVRATDDTRIFEIRRPAFERLTAVSPEFSLYFARVLAERVNRVNADLTETEHAYMRLIADQHAGARRELIGNSPSLKRLRARAKELAGAKVVAITGPAGTEKLALAWELHRTGPNPDGPFLVLDALAVTIFGTVPTDEVELELAQACALLGMRPGFLNLAGISRQGLLRAADGGTLVIENAESLAGTMQAQLAEFVRTSRYRPLSDNRDSGSSARIVLTGQRLPPESELAAMTRNAGLVLPPLRNRKQDILALIEHLARMQGRQHGKNLLGIKEDAHARLLAYDWPGNTAELEAVIRRAASLAQEEWLTSEDIFLTAGGSSSGPAFDLFRLVDPKSATLRRLKIGATLLGTGIFAFLLWQGWLGVRAKYGSAGVAITWVFWEPTIFLVSFLAARVWCGVCPIGAATGLMNRIGLNRRVPDWLRDRGVWLAAAGVAAILWSQAAFGVLSSMRATAVLIWAILLPALVVGLVFKRRAWCRYLCPLGHAIGAFSTCSVTELRGNPGVCGTHCSDHRCYVGTAGRSGCPMFEGPFSLRSNTHCVVCLDCVRVCENSSAALNLRLPGAELWTAAKPFAELETFIPAVIGAQFFRALFHTGLLAKWSSPLSLAIVCAACVGTAVWLARTAATAIFERADRGFLAHALVFLSASWEFAYQAGNLLSLGGTGWPPVMSLWAIKVLQCILCLGGLAACLAVLRELGRRQSVQTPGMVHFALSGLGAALSVMQFFGH